MARKKYGQKVWVEDLEFEKEKHAEEKENEKLVKENEKPAENDINLSWPLSPLLHSILLF